MGMEESGMTDRLLTTREVCRRLGISIKTLQVLRSNRKIAYLRFGHRSIRFREEAVEKFMQRREKAVNFAEVNQ
jgi:excisionase family DNA binding protein